MHRLQAAGFKQQCLLVWASFWYPSDAPLGSVARLSAHQCKSGLLQRHRKLLWTPINSEQVNKNSEVGFFFEAYVMTVEFELLAVEQFSKECSSSSWVSSSSYVFFAFEAPLAFSCSGKTCSCKLSFFRPNLLCLPYLHLENFFLPSEHPLGWSLGLKKTNCFFSPAREPK